MTIDTKRLATDAAYWDECGAPEDATHALNTADKTHWEKWEDGFIWAYSFGGWIKHNKTSDTIFDRIPRPTKPSAPEWDGEGLPPVWCKCIAQDSEFCKEVLVLAYADSHGEEKSVMLTEILEDGRHGRLHAFIARLINFSPSAPKSIGKGRSWFRLSTVQYP